jgi:hypothetical protein
VKQGLQAEVAALKASTAVAAAHTHTQTNIQSSSNSAINGGSRLLKRSATDTNINSSSSSSNVHQMVLGTDASSAFHVPQSKRLRTYGNDSTTTTTTTKAAKSDAGSGAGTESHVHLPLSERAIATAGQPAGRQYTAAMQALVCAGDQYYNNVNSNSNNNSSNSTLQYVPQPSARHAYGSLSNATYSNTDGSNSSTTTPVAAAIPALIAKPVTYGKSFGACAVRGEAITAAAPVFGRALMKGRATMQPQQLNTAKASKASGSKRKGR